MTGIERIQRQLQRKPVDRIGLYEHFWSDTEELWRAQGHLREDEDWAEHFGFDMGECRPLDLMANLDYARKTVQETEETITYLDGNGAPLRWKKHSSGTPEHINFTVRDRSGWQELKPFLTPQERRIDFLRYRKAKEHARKNNRFFCWCGVNVFECMHPVCGHEHMLAGMALDPDWVRDMVETYTNLTIALSEILFAREGKPDGIWFYEDMGYKGAPFLSPQMYKELIFPAHKRLNDFMHGMGLPVIMHSCGFIEPLLPGMVEAGIDALQAMEIKAGIDPIRIFRRYGDRIALMGGIDIRTLSTNDFVVIDRELEAKIPILKQNNGFILHTDHSVPQTVNYETYRYFIEKGLSL